MCHIRSAEAKAKSRLSSLRVQNQDLDPRETLHLATLQVSSTPQKRGVSAVWPKYGFDKVLPDTGDTFTLSR